MLDDFHNTLANALAGDEIAMTPWWADEAQGRAGLAIYRNTVFKGLADAIAASFPTVLKVVGEDWMRQAAIRFARANPPDRAALVQYGVAFPQWLAGFEPAGDMPYLADLARLDRLWTEVHLAADCEPMGGGELAALAPDTYTDVTLRLVPAVRIARFDTSVVDLWLALRPRETPDDVELKPYGQFALLWRPTGEVRTKILTPAAFSFLTGCANGDSLASAAEVAVALGSPQEFSLLFADLIASGVFAGVAPIHFKGRPE